MNIYLLFINCLLLFIIYYHIVYNYHIYSLFVQKSHFTYLHNDSPIITHSKCITNSSLNDHEHSEKNRICKSCSIFVISVYQVVVERKDETYAGKDSATIQEALANHQSPPISYISSRLHNQTLLSFSYHGLDRFPDDSDQE